jgi:hypothetical protein
LAFAFNRNSRALAAPRVAAPSVEPKSVSDVAPVKSPLNLSPAAFKLSSQFTTENKLFFGSQKVYDAETFDSKPQFRVDDDTSSKRSSSQTTGKRTASV